MWENIEGKLKRKYSLLSSKRVTAQYEYKISRVLVMELPIFILKFLRARIILNFAGKA